MRHCCLLRFDDNGGNLNGPLEELKVRLSQKEEQSCLFQAIANDFDSLVSEITRISGILDELQGTEYMEFFLLTKDVISIESEISVLLMALFSVLEARSGLLEVFWLYESGQKEHITIWTKTLPLLSFKQFSAISKDISLRHSVSFPMIGSIKLLGQSAISPVHLMLKVYGPASIVMGAVNVDWIRPFLFDDVVLPFEFDYSASQSTKSSVSALSAKQGLLLKLNVMHDHVFLFFDPHCKQIQMVQSVYISTIQSSFGSTSSASANNLTPQFVRTKRASTTSRQSSSVLDRSISLSDWNTTQDLSFSQDRTEGSTEDGLKKTNKEILKKLILLSLRRLGIKKDDKQFPTVWKHLYCGCVFALRKELSADRVDQSLLLKTIKDNIKFLNIGQKAS